MLLVRRQRQLDAEAVREAGMANQGFEPNRKNEKIRRANRTIQNRTVILMLIFGVLVFLLLLGQLYKVQISRHDELQAKALNQQTRSTEVTASRGTIYDRSGNIMAISATAETVFLSPKELNDALNDKDNPVTWTKESVAEKLAQILQINAESILKKMERTDSQYEVLKLRADEEVADQVRTYINESGVSGVYLVTDAKRYYPYGSLASHIIGFVGTDNSGLYGLEARYDDELQGQTGLVVTAKDPTGNDMLYEYEQYYAAQNGNDLMLTIDATVQYYLEKNLAAMAQEYNAKNGATGIIMDVTTGAIVAMASYPTYDLNDASTVQDSVLKAQIESGAATLGDMQLRQWRNKALNDTFEPGSTFKTLTLAAALEEGVIDTSTTYDCTGSIHVLDATIHCSNTAGHGHQTLEETAGNSCNPAFITYGLRLGQEKFYQYMRDFGLMEGTGIDLDGEATGIFMSPDSFSELDLACYAFGQNFNVTPIALITAQAACINGGYLHTPYVVERVVDSEGNVLSQQDTTPVRQVVSEETSQTVRECLEYVVSSGTGRNGQVSGYRIGGKTGTADKGKTGDVVVSFMCFAPADDPKYIMLLTMDTPSREDRTPSGGGMVAPVASRIMAEVLPYLGVEPSYSAEELLGADTTVPYVIGMSTADAQQRVTDRGFSVKVVGDGDTITDQTPIGGTVIPGKSRIILYAGESKPDTMCTVPSLVGKSASEANTAVTNAGLLIRFSGTTDSGSSSIHVIDQSHEAGSQVEAGTVITVQLSDSGVSD